MAGLVPATRGSLHSPGTACHAPAFAFLAQSEARRPLGVKAVLAAVLVCALISMGRESARGRLSVNPLRCLQLSIKNHSVALLRKNLTWHAQAKRCPPSFRQAFDGANEASAFLCFSRPSIAVIPSAQGSPLGLGSQAALGKAVVEANGAHEGAVKRLPRG